HRRRIIRPDELGHPLADSDDIASTQPPGNEELVVEFGYALRGGTGPAEATGLAAAPPAAPLGTYRARCEDRVLAAGIAQRTLTRPAPGDLGFVHPVHVRAQGKNSNGTAGDGAFDDRPLHAQFV